MAFGTGEVLPQAFLLNNEKHWTSLISETEQHVLLAPHLFRGFPGDRLSKRSM